MGIGRTACAVRVLVTYIGEIPTVAALMESGLRVPVEWRLGCAATARDDARVDLHLLVCLR